MGQELRRPLQPLSHHGSEGGSPARRYSQGGTPLVFSCAAHPGVLVRGHQVLLTYRPPKSMCYALRGLLGENHRIIEVGKDLKIMKSVNPTPPRLLNHVLKCHTYTLFEPLQGWGLHHLLGQPGPMSDRSCS